LYKIFKACIGSIRQKFEAVIREVRRRLLHLYNTCNIVIFRAVFIYKVLKLLLKSSF